MNILLTKLSFYFSELSDSEQFMLCLFCVAGFLMIVSYVTARLVARSELKGIDE